MSARKIVKQEVAKSERTTFTIRLTDTQKDAVTAAAQQMNFSPTRFMCNAVIVKAGEVLNSSGKAANTLRQLARALVCQLKAPETVLNTCRDGSKGDTGVISQVKIPHSEEVQSFKDLTSEYPGDGNYLLPIDAVIGAGAKSMSAKQLAQIETAIKSSGAEFLKMVLEEWNIESTQDYKPAVEINNLLHGSNDDD